MPVRARVQTKTKGKDKPRPKSSPVVAIIEPDEEPWAVPPTNTEDRLKCIEALGKRIGEHVRYMCEVEKVVGTSREAKDMAVTMFFDRLLAFEQELNRVQESLRLG